MNKKSEALSKVVNDSYVAKFNTAFKSAFDVEITTTYNILCMALVSQRVDGKPSTKEQRAWIDGYSTGYFDAKEQIR